MANKTLSSEQKYLESLCDLVEDKVIAARLRYLFDWYERKANENRKRYNLFRALSYLLPCLITLTSLYVVFFGELWGSTISATISVALAFVNHQVDHYRYYENMVRYRSTAEKLKRETSLYLNGCAPYDGNQAANRRAFAYNIEQYSAAELAGWENLQAESYLSGKEAQKELLEAATAAGKPDGEKEDAAPEEA